MGSVDLIKIDVEGFESKVLAGAVQTIEQWQPAILFEMAKTNGLKAGLKAESCIDFLRDKGYGIAAMLQMGVDGYDVFMVHGWKDQPRWVRIIQETRHRIVENNPKLVNKVNKLAME